MSDVTRRCLVVGCPAPATVSAMPGRPPAWCAPHLAWALALPRGAPVAAEALAARQGRTA